jgi:hypothetical protein
MIAYVGYIETEGIEMASKTFRYDEWNAPKSIHPRWADKARDAMFAVCVSNTAYSHVTDVKAHPDFPHKGSVLFTRVADGKRFKFSMTGGMWKCRPA